jgi:hypothetical protein
MALMDFFPQFGDNTDQVNPDDEILKSIDLKRKLALASSLKGNSETPQGQMIGNRYVAPSWTQYLASAVNKGMSEYEAHKAMKEQAKLVNGLLGIDTTKPTATSIATPSIDTTSQDITPTNALGLSKQGPTNETADLIGQANPNYGQLQTAQPATQPTAQATNPNTELTRLKIANYIMPDNQAIKIQLENALKKTDLQKNYEYGFGADQAHAALKANLSKDLMFTAPSGSQSTNMLTNQTSFVPKTNEGQIYTNGAITTTPGYLNSLSNITSTTEAAKKGYELVDVPMPDGTTRKMTVTQAAGLAKGGIGAQSNANQTNVVGQPNTQQNVPGIPILSETQKKSKELDITNAGDYEKNLNNTIAQGRNFMNRLNTSESALDQFQPGMGAGARLQVARAAKSLGMPEDLIKGINAGDIASKQVFQKLAVQQAMEALKQDMQSGRITQAEFQIYQDNLPNIETDPAAIKQLFNAARQSHAHNVEEQQAYAQYKKQGGDPGQWQAQWSKTQEQQRATNKVAPQLSPENQQALDWANANPNDARSLKIKQKLGVK